MAYIDECSFWPFLRLVEFHRLDANDETCYVIPAGRESREFHTGEPASASWDVAERSGVHGELDPLFEVITVQGEGGHIELVGWT
jgi:hypothetical protein